MREAHHVPLSQQSLAILRDMQALTGVGLLRLSVHSVSFATHVGKHHQRGTAEAWIWQRLNDPTASGQRRVRF